MSKAKALKEEKEWDNYWTKKQTFSQSIYRFIASFYRQFIIKKTLNHFIQQEFKTNLKLLHAGSGGGQVDEDLLSNYNVTALDISSEALKLYERNNGKKAKLMKASIFEIPAKSSTFDGIYNLGVMEHFSREEDVKILKEFGRILKPSGKIILFWPPKFGFTVMFLNSTHFVLNNILNRSIRLHPDEISLIQSKEHVEKILKEAGFKLNKMYFGPRDLFTYCVVIGKKA